MHSLYVTVLLQGEGSAIISKALRGHFRRAIFSSPLALLCILRSTIFSSPRFFKRRGLLKYGPNIVPYNSEHYFGSQNVSKRKCL